MKREFENQKKRSKLVVYWILGQYYHRMKAKIMKKIDKYEVKVNPELDSLLDLPLFQDKIEAGNALLSRVGIPSALRDRF